MSNHSRTRLQNTITNVTTATFVYIFSMGMALVVRAFLTRSLGQQYVGLNGVLTSIITSFSIADLGVDSVFIFLMYRPLSSNDYLEISKLLLLFKKVYITIGIIFLSIGVIASPFLRYMLGEQAMKIPYVYEIYFIFILNSGLSYFFAYYRILLNADQKSYVIAKVTFIVTLGTSILQIICLLLIKNFIIYATLLLINTVVTNIVVGVIVNKSYRPVFEHKMSSASRHGSFKDDTTIKTMIKNTVGGFSNKLGSVVVFSSDNIMLANFASLNVVGMYSNYIMITQGVAAFVSKIISSITASVGNLGVLKNNKKNLEIYLKLNFAMYSLIYLILLPMALLFSEFIKLWVGENSVLPLLSVELVVINFVLQIIRYPSLTFIDAFGLQWIQKWKSVVESIVNIFFSIIFIVLFDGGLNGVLLGTFLSNILVVNWYEPYIVLKYVCGSRFKEFSVQFTKFIFLFFIELVLSGYLLNQGYFEISFYKGALLVMIILIVEIIVYILIFKNESSFRYFLNLAKKFIKNKGML